MLSVGMAKMRGASFPHTVPAVLEKCKVLCVALRESTHYAGLRCVGQLPATQLLVESELVRLTEVRMDRKSMSARRVQPLRHPLNPVQETEGDGRGAASRPRGVICRTAARSITGIGCVPNVIRLVTMTHRCLASLTLRPTTLVGSDRCPNRASPALPSQELEARESHSVCCHVRRGFARAIDDRGVCTIKKQKVYTVEVTHCSCFVQRSVANSIDQTHLSSGIQQEFGNGCVPITTCIHEWRGTHLIPSVYQCTPLEQESGTLSGASSARKVKSSPPCGIDHIKITVSLGIQL
mmetsp:Transcript_59506/g.158294  ORF Transcript_59506/g.158294 Transcript_59506/m.158294 type:complete len:294 (+) Transcript_59506:264-1145(+)